MSIMMNKLFVVSCSFIVYTSTCPLLYRLINGNAHRYLPEFLSDAEKKQ